MTVSIIVPVFNEAATLAEFLRHLRERASSAELILVDGGSTDGSHAIACRLQTQLGLRVIQSRKGRAQQMNAGAAIASGDVLWFVHADSRIAPDAVCRLKEACSDPALAGGCFRLRIPCRRWIYRVSDSLGNAGVDAFRIALGDHGIFCTRKTFDAVGGFPLVPLMEDAEFYRRLRKTGRVRQLREQIETSPRFYKQHGPYRTTAVYIIILALYVLGIRPAFLARIHARIGRPGPRIGGRGILR